MKSPAEIVEARRAPYAGREFEGLVSVWSMAELLALLASVRGWSAAIKGPSGEIVRACYGSENQMYYVGSAGLDTITAYKNEDAWGDRVARTLGLRR